MLQRLLCGVIAGAVLAGCVAANLGRTDKEIIAQRAQERWDRLVKNDFTGAHGYISPPGRQLVTADAYAAGLRRNFWTGAKVASVDCTSPEACDVDVMIEYQHAGLKMKTPLREKWVRQGSNWWFVLER